jgi:Ca2+-binding RTX toxin-like protein
VNSGTGTATIFGSSGGNINLVGGGAATVVAGLGNETLNASGSTGSVVVYGTPAGTVPGSSLIIAGSGNDTLVAGGGPGATTMTGGSGTDTFVFFKQASAGGPDIIANFTASDRVFIEGYASTGSASALVNSAAVGSGNVTLTLSDGTTVTFANLSSASALNGKIQYG